MKSVFVVVAELRAERREEAFSFTLADAQADASFYLQSLSSYDRNDREVFIEEYQVEDSEVRATAEDTFFAMVDADFEDDVVIRDAVSVIKVEEDAE